jgi:hypothetical protein
MLQDKDTVAAMAAAAAVTGRGTQSRRCGVSRSGCTQKHEQAEVFPLWGTLKHEVLQILNNVAGASASQHSSTVG